MTHRTPKTMRYPDLTSRGFSVTPETTTPLPVELYTVSWPLGPGTNAWVARWFASKADARSCAMERIQADSIVHCSTYCAHRTKSWTTTTAEAPA